MFGRRWGLAAGVLAAGTVLTACGGSGWPQGAVPAPPASVTTSAAAPTTSGGTGGGSTDGGGSAGGTAAGSRCRYDDLKATVGRTTGEAGQRHTAIVWTNATDRPCTMTGFGGVDLDGPNTGGGAIYSLPRQQAQASTVRLAPGDRAHTTITWLPPQSGGGWTPQTILATPPDETRSAPLTWSGGAVERQDGATRPGTFIGPVRPGAED